MAAITTMSTLPKISQPVGVSKSWNMANFEGFQSTLYRSAMGKRKRSRESLGLDDEELTLSFHPSKRSKSGLQHIVPRFVLTSVSAATTRHIHPLPSTRRFLQPTKPAHPSTTSKPGRANGRQQLTNLTASRRKTPRTETSNHLACGFTIHEDTVEDEMGNLLSHWLEISDDNSHPGAKLDRGKQNMPPPDAVAAPARKTDGLRTPLGDLDVAEFYDL